MGLTMKDRKAITRELSERYKKATKKQKGIILDELTALTGYNRAYASYLLITHGKTIKVAKNRVIKADVNILPPLESGHRQFVEVKLSAYAGRKSL